jgi:hypothetical protein
MDRMTPYDVFKGHPQKKPLWLGTVNGLPRAIDLMDRMAARLSGDYFVCNAATHEVLASVPAAGPEPIRPASLPETKKQAS